MDPRFSFPTPDEYERWINRRIGEEVSRLRQEAGWSAYRLERIAGVKDQTIRNIERAVCDRGCMTGTLARIAYPFGQGLDDLVLAAAQP
jgi:transcriptional regulator with XRE-family HTH domain